MSRFGSKPRPAASLAAAVAATLAVAMSCRSAPVRPRVPAPPAAVVPEAGLVQPVIRIGIVTDTPRVSIGAASGITLSIRSAGAAAPRRLELPVATLLRSAGATPVSRYFRVQVASVVDELMARDSAERARAASGLPASLAWNDSTRSFQVRVGSFEGRDDAAALARRLGDAGFRGAWVVEEAREVTGTGLTLLETRELLAFATIVPTRAGESLSVDSISYRGLVEVRPGEGAALTVVNVLNLEDYLRGVVPNELSPAAFPQMEALKAQAIAARTYATRNRGQFQAKGYDLCATPACQVYKGRATEHPLSDRAVEETRGLVARWNGQPINALYTSTCGGHTEDGANIFEGPAEPYLRGVVCAPERKGEARLRTSASTRAVGDEEGLNHDVALLVALDVVSAKTDSPAGVTGAAPDGELRDWTARLMLALRRDSCHSSVRGSVARRASFFEHLVASLCWEERARRLLAPEDEGFLLRLEDADTLRTAAERTAAALLLQEGVLSPFSDNTLRGDEPLTRARALGLLARVVEKAGAPGLLKAEVEAVDDGVLRVRRGNPGGSEAYRVDPGVRLFRSLDGSRAAVSELSLVGGDRVKLVAREARAVFLEAEQSRLGGAADHTSKYYRWEARLTPEEVERGVSRYATLGRVRDVEVRRLGVSGRVVELAVRGSAGDLLLKGLRIRWALGLRENLFVVERERDAKGEVARFVFTGKGWGHGVGLCQVGAYGMAQAGSSAEQIIRHYYPGVSLARDY